MPLRPRDDIETRGRRRLALTLGLGYALGWAHGAAFIVRLAYRLTR